MAVPWGLDAGAPSGVACVGHERCLDAESGARRRRAAAPQAADGILRELTFHRARAERSGALARWYVQLHRGVVRHRRRGRPLHAERGHAQQCPRTQLGEQHDVCVTILLGRSDARHTFVRGSRQTASFLLVLQSRAT